MQSPSTETAAKGCTNYSSINYNDSVATIVLWMFSIIDSYIDLMLSALLLLLLFLLLSFAFVFLLLSVFAYFASLLSTMDEYFAMIRVDCFEWKVSSMVSCVCTETWGRICGVRPLQNRVTVPSTLTPMP